jgi:hypothetical protein
MLAISSLNKIERRHVAFRRCGGHGRLMTTSDDNLIHEIKTYEIES